MEELIQWPLVLFSLFAGTGGCAFAFAGTSEFTGGTAKARFAVGVISLVLAIVGGLFSVLHLASPQHVMAAVRHLLSFSGISVELIVLGLFVACAVVYLVLSKRTGVDGVRKGFAVAGAVFGVLLAFVTGHGYVISAKLAWNTEILPFAYLGTALSAGAFLFAATSSIVDAAFDVKRWAIPLLAVAIIGAVTTVAYLAYLQSAGFDAVGGQPVATWGGCVLCGIILPLGCAGALVGLSRSKSEQPSPSLAIVGCAGALVGGLAVRTVMWLFSEGFMELFAAGRVALNV